MIPGKGYTNFGKRARRAVATATALAFLCQNFAWAVCLRPAMFTLRCLAPVGGAAADETSKTKFGRIDKYDKPYSYFSSVRE